MQDVEMNQETTSVESGQRKIVRVKKSKQVAFEPIIDENGEELEFEGSVEENDEEEDIVHNDDDDDVEGEDWEDVDSEDDEKMKDGSKNTKKKEIWDETKEPLQEDEELVYDSSAYQMLHRAKVEWPCLSCDVILRDRVGLQDHSSWFPQYVHALNPQQTKKDAKTGLDLHKQDKFPYTVYFCAGSQSEKKNDNKIYVMKWADMRKTLMDDLEEDSESDEEQQTTNPNKKDPETRYECVPHKGCVNRIRSLHGTGIVATWNDQGEVGIYNISPAIEALD